MRSTIADVEIDPYSFDEVVRRVIDHAQNNGEPAYVVTPNAQHIVLLQQDPKFRQIYRQAFLRVPDGVPLLWAAKFLKTPLRSRVNGTDLFERLCAVAADRHLRIFLLGGRPEAAECAKAVLQARHPHLQVVGTHCPPYGFESNASELALINSKIVAAAPHLLFVGLGAPKQEKWIYANYQVLNVPVSLGIGVSFELVGGLVKRAPVWMQKTGLEWLFRLIMEPQRLWRRYVVGNTQFIWLILQQRLGFARHLM